MGAMTLIGAIDAQLGDCFMGNILGIFFGKSLQFIF
jgi:hypothetical protein